MKVWITKYALTKGIFTANADVVAPGMIKVSQGVYYHGRGRDWHESFSDAQRRAYDMRDEKIKSLKKMIAKLEKMGFQEEAT